MTNEILLSFFLFQVQLQEETLEEDQAWPVNTRVHGSPCLPHVSICRDLQLLGLSMLAWSSSFVQTLVMLMFDIKRSVIKLENEAVILFPFIVSVQVKCFSVKQNQMSHWVWSTALYKMENLLIWPQSKHFWKISSLRHTRTHKQMEFILSCPVRKG